MHTPDICLIQGFPGTGKLRVIAEILRQAARRCEQTLLVAPSTAAIDQALANLGRADDVYALREVGANEDVAKLLPAIRAMTFSERSRAVREDTLQLARAEVANLENKLRRRSEQEILWEGLEQLVEQREQGLRRLGELSGQRGQLPRLLEAEATAAETGTATDPSSPLVVRLRRCQEEREERLASLEAARAKLATERARAQSEQQQFAEEAAQHRLLEDAQRARAGGLLPGGARPLRDRSGPNSGS